MRITFSKHALKRAEERGVSINTVEKVLKEPEEIIAVKYGRKATYKRLRCQRTYES